MQAVFCKIVRVDETIRRVIINGGNEQDAENLQIIGDFEKTLAASTEPPICGACDEAMRSMPYVLAIFRVEGSSAFASSGICNRCKAREPAELAAAASARYSETLFPTAGSA